MFSITDTCYGARRGRLAINGKSVDTPVFMPVVTRASEQAVWHRHYHHLGANSVWLPSMGFSAVICNALLFYLHESIQGAHLDADLEHYFNLSETLIATDSGGFQVTGLSSLFSSIEADFIRFIDPQSKNSVDWTPRLSIETQNRLNSDIALCLDCMPAPKAGYSETAERVERTYQWAVSTQKYHCNSRQILAGIAQGGPFPDLRAQSAKQLADMQFEIVALGGLKLISTLELKRECIIASFSALDAKQLRYVMGIGDPIDILQMVALGADMFDAAFPTICSAKGIKLTRHGMQKQTLNADSTRDRRAYCELPIIPTSSIYLGEEVDELARHNLRFMQEFMADIRDSIRNNDFLQFALEFSQSWDTDAEIGAQFHNHSYSA